MKRYLLALVALLAGTGEVRADAFSTTAPAPAGLASTSGQMQLKAYDGTVQFQAGLTPGAVEFWSCQGGTLGIGGTCYATNGIAGSATNVNGNFVTQNAGNFFFATGTGTAFEIADAGAAATSFLVATPGTASASPKLSSTVSVNLNGSSASIVGGSGFGVTASYGGFQQFIAAPIGTGTPSSIAWIQVGNSSGDSSGHITCAGATNTACFFSASGTGAFSLANASGTQVTYSNSSANTAVSGVSFRAASTTQPVLMQALVGASANIAAGGGSGAMTALATNATTGFFGIPTVAGIPTGVPTHAASGAAFIVYNPTTHNLNVYDNAASSWYHVALTAGGG